MAVPLKLFHFLFRGFSYAYRMRFPFVSFYCLRAYPHLISVCFIIFHNLNLAISCCFSPFFYTYLFSSFFYFFYFPSVLLFLCILFSPYIYFSLSIFISYLPSNILFSGFFSDLSSLIFFSFSSLPSVLSYILFSSLLISFPLPHLIILINVLLLSELKSYQFVFNFFSSVEDFIAVYDGDIFLYLFPVPFLCNVYLHFGIPYLLTHLP